MNHLSCIQPWRVLVIRLFFAFFYLNIFEQRLIALFYIQVLLFLFIQLIFYSICSNTVSPDDFNFLKNFSNFSRDQISFIFSKLWEFLFRVAIIFLSRLFRWTFSSQMCSRCIVRLVITLVCFYIFAECGERLRDWRNKIHSLVSTSFLFVDFICLCDCVCVRNDDFAFNISFFSSSKNENVFEWIKIESRF